MDRHPGPQSHNPILAFFRRLPPASAVLAIGVATLVLAGWKLDVTALKSVLPGLIAMNPMTAVSFILAGLSLLLQMRGTSSRHAGKALASVVALTGLSKVSDLVLHTRFSLDRLLFAREMDVSIPINRMAPNTAFSFVLLGLALLALEFHENRRQLRPRLLILPVLLLALMALLGYAYGERSFYHMTITPMALHTALVFWCLGLGVFLLDPERGMTGAFIGHDAGAVVIRRLMPVALVVIPLLGWLQVRGHHAGFYTADFGVALGVLSNCVLLLAILWHTAGTLRHTDLERQEANRALQQAHDDLELRVRERTAELEETNRTLTRESEERANVERALLLSRERFRAFMDNSPAVAFIKDREGRLLYVNRLFEQVFNKRFADVEGLTDAELWPENLARKIREDDRTVLVERRQLEFTYTVPSPGGEPRQWMSLKFPLEDASGELLLGGMAIDISDRAAAEATLRKTEDQLRQSQKMEAVGRLAGGVAHDFNNMLTAIMGFSQLIKLRLGPDSPAQQDAGEIERAAERAATLTRQLLAFSRQQVLRPQVLDLGTVVAGMEPMLRRLIGADVRIATDSAADLRSVRADPGQIEQVVMNLVVNSRDAMPGAGKIIIETSNVMLDASGPTAKAGVEPGSYVMLAVSDTGNGMDAATKERIFEPFFTTKELGKGTGLGLSTVYGIVKQSGGHIDVYSEPGHGTSFKIYLPSVADPALTDVQRRETVVGGSETILVVEDEPMVRAVMHKALELSGYTVLDAGDGLEGLEALRRPDLAIDLLITDLTMPNMGGSELGDQAARIRPGLRVLYVSGYADKAVVHGGFLSAGTPFLPKPFTPEAFLRRVRELLDEPASQAA